jgi:tRNA nucleotidyltransferase/poly(A) polymerase
MPVIQRELIDPDADKVVRRLRRYGFTAYLVGGCVRDLLLRRSPKDFDVATSATPSEIKSIFRNCRVIGRRFRLAHIFFGAKIIETSTFRANPRQGDSPDDADDLLIRRDNVFGSAEEDARRRDFTVNGLFYDVEEEKVIDYVGGLDDLQARMVRTIGDPEIRFPEDPVRILRAIKFAARLGFDIEPDTYAALLRHEAEILQCAPPRVLEEVYRLMRGGAARRSMELLLETGVAQTLAPDLVRMYQGPASYEGADIESDETDHHATCRAAGWRALDELDALVDRIVPPTPQSLRRPRRAESEPPVDPAVVAEVAELLGEEEAPEGSEIDEGAGGSEIDEGDDGGEPDEGDNGGGPDEGGELDHLDAGGEPRDDGEPRDRDDGGAPLNYRPAGADMHPRTPAEVRGGAARAADADGDDWGDDSSDDGDGAGGAGSDDGDLLAEPPSNALLITVLAAPFMREVRGERPGDLLAAIDEILGPLATRLRISRRDAERARQIMLAHKRLAPARRRRARPMALVRRDTFVEALTLYELVARAKGEPGDEVRRWRRLWRQSVASTGGARGGGGRGAASDGDERPADAGSDRDRARDPGVAPAGNAFPAAGGKKRRRRRGGRRRHRATPIGHDHAVEGLVAAPAETPTDRAAAPESGAARGDRGDQKH